MRTYNYQTENMRRLFWAAKYQLSNGDDAMQYYYYYLLQ